MSMKMTNLFIITGFSLVIFCYKNPEKVQTRDPIENQVANRIKQKVYCIGPLQVVF